MTDDQTETIIKGLRTIYSKLNELNDNVCAVSHCISSNTAEVNKRQETTARILEMIDSTLLIVREAVTAFTPVLNQIKESAKLTEAHTMTERNHVFRILHYIRGDSEQDTREEIEE
ncbi:MAG: hypothetical protein K6G61_06395 [Solobacterium sp.]|nr:hypothetical protein [Solobacterium sp.]